MTIHQTLVLLPLVRGTKRPMLVRWSDPVLDPDTVARVFAENPGCGVGIRLDGLVVIDCDSPERVSWWLEQGFPTEFMSRGRVDHRSFWYRLPEDVEMRTTFHQGYEIRTSHKQHCAVPPSVHKTGRLYEWLGPPVDEKHLDEMPLAPVDFLESIAQGSRERPVGAGEGWDAVVEGEGRDNFLASLGGFLHRWGMSEAAARSVLAATNHLVCEPTMSAQDISRIARSTSRYEDAPIYSFEVVDEGTEVQPRPARPSAGSYRYSLVVHLPDTEGSPDPGGG